MPGSSRGEETYVRYCPDWISGPGQEAHCGQPGGGRHLLEMRLVFFVLELTTSQLIFYQQYSTGYIGDHFKGEKDWEARLMMELSRAVKCPSVNGQLAGFKKVSRNVYSQSGQPSLSIIAGYYFLIMSLADTKS